MSGRPTRTGWCGRCPVATSRRWCSPAGCCGKCRVLLLDEPTRGVDVGSRSEIYLLIRDLADSGVAVVVVSSEVEEVLGLADRVLVVAAGRVLHDGPAADIDENQVLDLIMGGTAA